ncbi:hypothetical protein BM221_006910 [Beauveria bassiana]|uniref:Uncharacterized protein n=1 Tax=Beauveria bassiana TaxID=176275 RepID=A0A2N6NIY1_BEABA|nr:hypothetical protein BM221_006910 [Beauveria bassiana]
MAAYRWAAGPAGVLGMNMQERAGPRGGEEGGKGKRIEKEVRPETAGDSGGKTTVAKQSYQYQLVNRTGGGVQGQRKADGVEKQRPGQQICDERAARAIWDSRRANG